MTNTSKVAWARLDCLHSPKIWVMWGPLSDLGLFDPSYSLSRHACDCFQDCARWCVWSPFFLFIFVLFLSWVFLQFDDMIAWESFMLLGLLCVFWGCLDDCCVVSWKSSQCLVGIGNMFRSVPPCCELVANCSM